MLLHLLLIDVMLFGIATKCSSSNWWSIHSWKACSGYSRQCLLVHLSRKALMLFESSSRKCNKMFILQLMVHPQLKSLLWLFEAKCARTLVGGLALVLFDFWMDGAHGYAIWWSLQLVFKCCACVVCILYFVFVSNVVDIQSIALVGSSKSFRLLLCCNLFSSHFIKPFVDNIH